MPCDESWIYCYDPEKHARSPRPKKARQSKSDHKLLMIPFFDNTGMNYMLCVPIGQTVNKEYYVEVLKEFRKRFRLKRPDLAPCDFWLFHKLRGCRYETNEEMKEAVRKVIDTLTRENFHGAFQKLLERYKCI